MFLIYNTEEIMKAILMCNGNVIQNLLDISNMSEGRKVNIRGIKYIIKEIEYEIKSSMDLKALIHLEKIEEGE